MKRKYIVHPGYVISKEDGDEHFIRAEELMRLYKVDKSECYIYKGLVYDMLEGYIHLYPDPTGKYEINEFPNN